MTLVISRNHVLDPSDIELENHSPNAPMIGWNNQITRNTATATSQDVNYPINNILTPSTAEYWVAQTIDDQVIIVMLNQTITIVQFVGIVRHNLGSSGAKVKIEALTTEWELLVDEFVPMDDGVIFMKTNVLYASSIRITIRGGKIPARLAVLSAGSILNLQRNIYVGHTPIQMGRSVRLSTGISESGNYLGKIVLGESHKTQIDMKHLTPNWYRKEMDPFIKNTIDKPFFFAWRPQNYPLEVGYCWFDGVPIPKNQLNNGMMEISMSLSGVIDRNSSTIYPDRMDEAPRFLEND